MAQLFRILTIILVCGLASGAQAGAKNAVKVGVLAWRGAEMANAEWAPVMQALNKALPKFSFSLIPLDLDGMEKAVSKADIDFFITNPGNYADLEQRYGAGRLATMETTEYGTPDKAVGSVIFTRADRKDIRKLSDLYGKSVLAVAKRAFGGFEIAWGVLQKNGIDPFSDLSKISFIGFPLDRIVYQVRDGKADAGIIRACLLEHMAKEGKIELQDYQILNQQKSPQLDCALSSPLYPNWPFAKIRTTDHQLAKEVAIALLAMDGQAVKHWTIPFSYQSVLDLFRFLRIGPYVISPGEVILEYAEKYWGWFGFAALLMVLGFVHVARTEYFVRLRTRELKESQEKSQLRLTELACVSRRITLGELANGLAHEINQPLGAIANYAAGCSRAIDTGAAPETLKHPLGEISRQAEHAGRILKNIRNYLKSSFDGRDAVSINTIIHDAVDLLGAEIRSSNVTVNTDFTSDLPKIPVNRIAIEQVAVNLIRNGVEAMRENGENPRHLGICTRQTGDMIETRISDSGAGLSEKQLEQLFEPFHTTKVDGMGLGLSISRSIIENHDGEIKTSINGAGGLTVSFLLPVL